MYEQLCKISWRRKASAPPPPRRTHQPPIALLHKALPLVTLATTCPRGLVDGSHGGCSHVCCVLIARPATEGKWDMVVTSKRNAAEVASSGRPACATYQDTSVHIPAQGQSCWRAVGPVSQRDRANRCFFLQLLSPSTAGGAFALHLTFFPLLRRFVLPTTLTSPRDRWRDTAAPFLIWLARGNPKRFLSEY